MFRSCTVFIAILFLTITQRCISQTQSKEHLSGFLMTSLTYKFNSRWMAYTELQARSIEHFTPLDYTETKGGIGYNIDKNNQPFIGFGRYITYREHERYQRELRLWLQYTFTNKIGKLKMDHRGRAEQRFFHYPQTDVNKTDQRFRYRLSATLPINSKKVEPKTFFINGFEELFFGPKADLLKRSRLFAGFGYQFTKTVGTSTGYMWQRELAPSGNRNLHFIYLALNFVLDKKGDHERHIDVPVAD
ncbi:DUF2490 domain-containing protein [Niabella sp. CC-SYL272]|uniref:DUF2490 domain-containing protein n=1 Tax=Niabella agricola TaxID=2891571 RepID=UPI002104AC0E|nr:DUF2490 domain-containing protein [Niabella agricola]MCF3110592.1 DUF2490 domain-containing protein [Niabella agricola]